MRRLYAFVRGQRSQATVEFALVGIILFVLVLGTIDVGRAVWSYNTLVNATREGTRYAIVHGANASDPSGPGSPHYTAPDSDTNVIAAVEAFSGGLDMARLDIATEWPEGTNEVGRTVKVTSTYNYDPVLDFMGFLNIDISSSSTMTITH